MLIFIHVFMVLAIALILVGILVSLQPSPVRRIPLPKEEGQVETTKMGSYISTVLPFTQKLLEKLKLDAKIKNRLDAAHINLTPGQFFNIKLGLLLLAVGMVFFVLKKFEPIVLLAALALGYALPELWLRRRINQRKYEIARVLPETVDLLGLCVEAGLDFTTSVKWVIEKKVSSNPLIEELTLVLEEIKWGKPRSQALKDMSKRLNIPEVSSFVQALVQTERMGTPVSEAFGIISEDTRLQRYRRGERYALQAPIKILIPLIFCILPVIAIIIGGPILLQFTQGGVFAGFGK